MESRLGSAATRLNRILFGKQFPAKRAVNYASSTGRTAEHAVDHEEQEVYPSDEKLRHTSDQKPTTNKDESYIPPIGSPGVGPQTEPIVQQKRRRSALSGICAGIDGSPLPGQEERETDRRTQREEEERYDREYFKDRKASPLSEIEIAETRKPVTVATDATAPNDTVGVEGRVWRPEQLETAEETMRKAAEIFRWNAIRGDPDSPHGRVIRQLRREYW